VFPNRPTVWSVALRCRTSSVLRPGTVLGDLPGVRVGDLQVEDQVLPGDLTERLGATDVEGVGVAELPVELRPTSHGVLQVQRVGGVEGGGAVGDAVIADLVQAQVDMTVLLGLAASFFGAFGVEPDQGFFDEPVDLRPAAAVREQSQLSIHERRRVRGQQPGGVGDPPAPSRPAPHRPAPGPRAWGGGGRAR
jgi:hypothetical protein